MYSRILLAYDGSVEGRTALREGAILARQSGAQVFLLSVLADIGTLAKLVRGQPAEEIGKYAEEIGADLIVVGHRRQSAFDRWWSGPKGAYLMDHTDCSLLVARNAVSDEAIQAFRVAK
jgi:nucleotide-binding universal stress UspA family protein